MESSILRQNKLRCLSSSDRRRNMPQVNEQSYVGLSLSLYLFPSISPISLTYLSHLSLSPISLTLFLSLALFLSLSLSPLYISLFLFISSLFPNHSLYSNHTNIGKRTVALLFSSLI
jgi:hypothetical protein